MQTFSAQCIIFTPGFFGSENFNTVAEWKSLWYNNSIDIVTINGGSIMKFNILSLTILCIVILSGCGNTNSINDSSSAANHVTVTDTSITFTSTSVSDFTTFSSVSTSETAPATAEEPTVVFIPDTTAETAASSEITTESDIAEPDTYEENDPALMNILSTYGYSLDSLSDSSQLITVSSSGISCKVDFFEKADSSWRLVHSTYGNVGKNGVSIKSAEGDYCTPQGLYSLGFAFGTEYLQLPGISYRQISQFSCWVDDPYSAYYNQWVESDQVSPDWNSAEHMADYQTAYHYGVVINYNMSPVIPNAGSAIFLHCISGSYTAGCVAVPDEDMLFALNWLNSSSSPLILIN